MNIEYVIKRSKRRKRTVALKIDDNGNVIIMVPYRMSSTEIHKFVQSKEKWIQKHITNILEKKKKIKSKKFQSGEYFLYLGKRYKLIVHNNVDFKLHLTGENFILSSDYALKAKDLFINWYKEAAYLYISEKALYFADILKVKFKNIKIISARSRWGSCSADNRLHFNYKIIMAPGDVVDYVVLHEVAHIIEKNHSKRFWNIVGKIMPDYKIKRKWLRENGFRLYV